MTYIYNCYKITVGGKKLQNHAAYEKNMTIHVDKTQKGRKIKDIGNVYKK